MGKRWRIAAVNFDHFHMGDLLRMAWEHPNAEIVGICDTRLVRMQEAIASFPDSSGTGVYGLRPVPRKHSAGPGAPLSRHGRTCPLDGARRAV